MDVLSVKQVTKDYGQTKVLKEVSFSVADGEFVAIMGTSGSGKTTLLNSIATLDKINSGEILINNQNIANLNKEQAAKFRKEKLGFVFQDYKLLSSLTARRNVALSLTLLGNEKAQTIDDRIDALGEMFELTNVLENYPHELSGGQKQRVAIMRAIIKKPQLLLADEPTGALDSNSTNIIMKKLAEINKKLATTILMVTHDAFAASFADRVFFLKDGEINTYLERGKYKTQGAYQKGISDVMLDLEEL